MTYDALLDRNWTFRCDACRKEFPEYYMVHDHLWRWGDALLCIGCLEAFLHRTLTADDFTECLVNDTRRKHMSPRLRDRLTRKVESESTPSSAPGQPSASVLGPDIIG